MYLIDYLESGIDAIELFTVSLGRGASSASRFGVPHERSAAFCAAAIAPGVATRRSVPIGTR
jgi:hypothetical protein